MPYADRDMPSGETRADGGVAGFAGAAAEIKSLLTDLAGEIDETRRRQSHALLQIERRLFSLQGAKGEAPTHVRGRSSPADREPWDRDSAEALARVYDGAADEPATGYETAYSNGHAGPGRVGAGEMRDWLQSRFADISQHIARTLTDIKPNSSVRMLGERLERFHNHVDTALYDVARRSDLDGLKLIETQVAELGAKLSDIQSHLKRLDGIKDDLHSVMEQVTSGQLLKLSEHESILAEVIDTTAARTAEALHAKLAEANAISAADEGRFDALRNVIESAMIEYRQTEATTTAAVARLNASTGRHAERLDDLRVMIEDSITERRKGDQDALSALDTVQHALVQVLDRMDTIETVPEPHARHTASTLAADQASASGAFHAEADETFEDDEAYDDSVDAAQTTTWHQSGAATYLDVDFDGHPTAANEADEDVAETEAMLSPVEKMRRDFIADAQRAKLKATSLRPPEGSGKASAIVPGRLFGVSSKLLAGVLGLVIAINGGLLILPRQTSAPSSTVETPAGTSNSAVPPTRPQTSLHDATPEGTGPGQRSDVSPTSGAKADNGVDGTTVPAADALATAAANVIFKDNLLGASGTAANSDVTPAIPPRGTVVEVPQAKIGDETLAAIYQQQVLAGLSHDLGGVASRSSQQDLLPERGAPVDAAFTPPADTAADDAPDKTATAGHSSALDLPPSSVGPLSLRLAAANGDASAEFEVASRLAEGKGTIQNFKEAVRWYQRSAAHSFAQSQYRLGTLYERGLGVGKDLGRARTWYQRAAELGNIKAMHNLAVLAAGGEGSAPDYATATSWFIKAAEHGLPDSQYNLAVLFESGLGVGADRKAAYKWYALAARGGDKDATERRDALKPTLTPADLKAAEEMVKAFSPQMSDPLANDARAAGEDWKKRADADSNR